MYLLGVDLALGQSHAAFALAYVAARVLHSTWGLFVVHNDSDGRSGDWERVRGLFRDHTTRLERPDFIYGNHEINAWERRHRGDFCITALPCARRV